MVSFPVAFDAPMSLSVGLKMRLWLFHNQMCWIYYPGWVRLINCCFCDVSLVSVGKSLVLVFKDLVGLKVRLKQQWLQPRYRRHFHRGLNLLIWFWFRVQLVQCCWLKILQLWLVLY